MKFEDMDFGQLCSFLEECKRMRNNLDYLKDVCSETSSHAYAFDEVITFVDNMESIIKEYM